MPVTDANGILDPAPLAFTMLPDFHRVTARADSAQHPTSASRPRATASRLLVVDDEPGTRNYLRDLLSLHHAVELAADGQAAMEIIRHGPPPDLILSDVLMPRVDGLALVRAVRENPDTAALPVLLITGDDDADTRRRGFEAGADDFISKPFRPPELLARVRTHLDLARLRREEAAPRPHADDEPAVRASEGRYRAIVNQATAGVAEIDAEGRFILVNRKFCDLMGYSEEEMLRLKVSNITHPEDYPRCLELFERTLATGEPAVNEKRHLRKDGTIIWIADSISRIPAEGDQPARVVAVIIDITENKRAVEALRLSEEHFRLVVNSTREYAIFSLDAQGRVATWNVGGERLKGYRAEEIIGQPISIFCTPEDIASGAPERQLSTAIAQGVADGESLKVRKDGTRFWGDELLFPMRGAGGDLLGFVKVCRDMTDRKAADDERTLLLASEQNARREAEAANAAKDRFLAALSHELRTPLVPVQMALFVLEREPQLSADARESVEMIRRNVALETRLIGDLLDVSRIMHGKLELTPGFADLHACVQGGIESCRAQIEERALELAVALEALEDTVDGDAMRLQQAFCNLLENAAKFTPAGGKISVRSRNAGRRIIVEISDTGAGIAAEALPRLFHAFEQRPDDTPRPHGGLGLGLAISQAIIQTLGGQLTAASAGRGKGATFTVELPLSAGPAAETTA